MCMHQKEALKYMRQTLTDLKGEIDEFAIIVRDFRTSLSEMDIPASRKLGRM